MIMTMTTVAIKCINHF